jgi:hypothetical protein
MSTHDDSRGAIDDIQLTCQTLDAKLHVQEPVENSVESLRAYCASFNISWAKVRRIDCRGVPLPPSRTMLLQSILGLFDTRADLWHRWIEVWWFAHQLSCMNGAYPFYMTHSIIEGICCHEWQCVHETAWGLLIQKKLCADGKSTRWLIRYNAP